MGQPRDVSRRVRLLRRAVELGLVREEEVSPSSGHAEETLSAGRLAEIFDRLVQQGRIDPARLALQLPAESADADNPSRDRLAFLVPPEPDASLLQAEFPLPRGDRYLPLAFLGDGGMGRVFKAWDQQLHRVVALKFLKRLEPDALERFLMEARAQAQLDHPNVCRVYSVGQEGDHAFLAMQLIEGPTLRTALPQLNLDQIARIARDVAEALHACHRLGILHRDIKPSNIMLERAEDGGWHPFLMDFGLARELGSGSHTVSGVIVGTPVYASPEQVQGRTEALDRRADVYALGATLYECLCGEPPIPFRGSLADLVRRIAEEEPVPPRRRRPSLPRDLGTIVLKCLEKDPGRRYPSARALAEDLQRYLEGDPIHARGRRLGYRLVKRLRKNRALATVTALSLLALAGTAAWGARLVVRARLQAQYAQRLARETERLHAQLALASTLPVHDIRADRQRLEAEIQSIRLELAGLGSWAQAPGRLAIGKGLLALDRLEEARTELEEAHRLAPGDPEAALALGLALARSYGEEMEGLRGRAREERRRALEPTLLRPAVELLQKARSARMEAPGYAEGTLALVEDRTEEAIAKAREAFRRAPWAWEALVLEADAHKADAALRLSRGDHAGAEQALERAGTVLEQARAIARSAPRPHEAEAQRRFLRLAIRFDQNRATSADRAFALAGVAETLRVDPDNFRVLGFKAAIHRRWALARIAAGEDPREELTAAAEACESGLRIRPQDNALINNLASILRNKAGWEMDREIDPEPDLRRAIAMLEEALTRPRHADLLWNNLGNCHALVGHWRLLHGRDPVVPLQQAVACLARASEIRPWVGHAASQGEALLDLAWYRAWQGQDPGPDLEGAMRAFEQALQLNPNSHQAHEGLAVVLLVRTERAQDQGRSAGADLDRAQAHLDKALALNPDFPTARWRRVHLRALRPAGPGRDAELRAALLAAQGPAADGPDLRWAKGQALLAAGRAGGGAAQAGALEALRRIAARSPADGRIAYLEGRLLLAMNRPAEALRTLARAGELNPNLRRAADAATGSARPRG